MNSINKYRWIDRRIQSQYDHLDQEYRQTYIEVLRNSNTRGCGKVITIKRIRIQYFFIFINNYLLF